jgi:hypothetical protein
MRWLVLMVLALSAVGGRSKAAPDPLAAAVFRTRQPAAALPERSDPPRDIGLPTTSVERRFGRGGLTGSAGFLCGLQPKAMADGAAAAYGVDPHGRYLGVKLRMVLR